jgi:hypothetical protein
MERKRRAHHSSASIRCRSEAGVMSDPVGARADGVAGAGKAARIQGVRIQGTGKTENCVGLVVS